MILNIPGEYLSYNPKLEDTMRYRQEKRTENPIDKQLNIKDYECLIGVPYGFGYLIGEEIYFLSDKLYGPWLVVDVESENHQGIMTSRNLLADVNCKDMVHTKGKIVMPYIPKHLRKKLRREQDDMLQYGDDLIQRRDKVMAEMIEREVKKLSSIPQITWDDVYPSSYEPNKGVRYNYDIFPEMVRAEPNHLALFNNYVANPLRNQIRRNAPLKRIEPNLPPEIETRYFYIPNDASNNIIKGAIESLFQRKDVEYSYTLLSICYLELPEFERVRVVGVSE